MINLITLVLILSAPLWAQVDFAQEREKILLKRQENLEWEQVVLETQKEYQELIQKKQTEFDFIEDTIKKRPELVGEALKSLDEQISKRPTARRKRFFNCVIKNLESSQLIQLDSCGDIASRGFSAEDRELVKKWERTLGVSSKDLGLKQQKLARELELNKERLKNTEGNLTRAKNFKEKSITDEKMLDAQIKDYELVTQNSKYIDCSAVTPEISLEEEVPFPGAIFKGPFFGVPRDNQDGLGTCYANTAKNLLVSTSQGEDVASFLDLALLFKGEAVSINGLDSGGSCTALEKMEEKGYCPQEYAPAEQGEKNHLAQGLMGGKTGNIYDQSVLLKLIQDFIRSQEVLTKNNKKFSDQALGQANLIVHNLKSRPNIKLPFPVARFPIPNVWKLKESMHFNDAKEKFTEEDFMKDYNESYKKFYPEYVKGIMEGKNRDDIFSHFQVVMKDFIEKYSLGKSMEVWKRMFLFDTNQDWNSPDLKKEIAQSIELMKAMSGKAEVSDDDFLKSCDKTVENFEFLTTLQPLMTYLTSVGADADLLYDETGKFKSPEDLMQLAVAPACLNPANRKKPKSSIVCESGYQTINDIKNSNKPIEAQKRMLREKVVANLLQGYAMGNTFDRHINTIVGMRFNQEKSRCEFKIRESQTGTSDWHDEGNIFNEIEALTEVRRK